MYGFYGIYYQRNEKQTDMAEKSAMPLWLDIKKEYIDENFEGVISYLHKRVKNAA